MELDPEFCYRIILSRDSRFDGRFFTAVKTTGIYCRTVCPAPKPKQKNVIFFKTAAAAESAGFRPCLRCRPEAAPSNTGFGVSETIFHAMNLIDDGFLDEQSVASLASKFQMTDRHLRRIFEEQLGAAPGFIASTRRLHFARRLLEETPLSVTEVAFASGFSSLRRFNSAFKSKYAMAPSLFRKQGKLIADEKQELALKLCYRPPFNWEHLLRFLRMRAIDQVEWVSDDSYCRTVSFSGGRGQIEIRHLPQQNSVLLKIPFSLSRSIMHLVESVKKVFDLKADPAAIHELLSRDSTIAPIVRANPGLRLPGAWNWFEIAVRAVLGQQITVKAARTLAQRIVEKLGTPLNGANSGKLFPLPEQFLNAPLTGLGVPSRRIDAIRHIAKAAVEGEIQPNCGSSVQEKIRHLCSIPGIGPWTAHYIALRAFGEPDVFLPGDLVLHRVASHLVGKNLTDLELSKLSERWQPWRSYAVIYLWNAS